MAEEILKRDVNRIPVVAGLSDDASLEVRALRIDPSTGRLKVSSVGTVAQQYDEGDTDSSITGLAIMWEDASDTLRAVSAAKPLPVNIITSPVPVSDNSGSLTIDGSVTANAGTNLNTSALALESGGNLETIAGAVSGSEFQVDVVASLPAGTNTVGAVETDGTALSNGQVAVNATAGGTTIIAASAGRQGVDITNQGATDCYIGTGTLTTSNGFLLKAGESLWMPTDSEIKGIVSSGSTTIGYLAYA